MATLTAPTKVRDAATPPPGRLLRVSRPGQPERTFELGDGKCTIGSSPRCQVCLPASDARPMQCLLTLEADAATVTRWAAGVLLNGHEFATATLGAGDRLTIGPWEIALAPPKLATSPQGEAASAAGRPAQNLPTPTPTPPPAPQVATPQSSPPLPAPPTPQPQPVVTEPEATVGASQLRQVEEALAELMAEASAPASPERVGTKTIHMASRKTAPVIPPTPPRPSTAASQTYADRLLLHLWTANHQARSRCAALLNATRTSRGHAANAVADQAAVADVLAQARADHQVEAAAWNTKLTSLQTDLADRSAEQQRLQLEFAAHAERQVAGDEAAERLAELTAELAAAEQSMAQLGAELAERDQRLQELTGVQAIADDARAKVEEQLQQQHERAEQLQSEIDRLQAVIERVDAEHSAALQAAHAERDELRDALAALEAAVARQAVAAEPAHETPEESTETFTEECAEDSTEELAEDPAPQLWTTQSEVAQEVIAGTEWDAPVESTPASESADWYSRWQLQPVETDPAPSEPSAEESEYALPAYLAAPADAAEPEVAYAEPEQDAVEPEYATEFPTYEEPAPEADSQERTPFGFLEAPIDESPLAPPINEQIDEQIDEPSPPPPRSYGDELTPGLAAESPEPAYATPSFIDRYRGLMEDDADSNPLRASSPARALLDEEHLSPAQARTGDDPEDDADEALEAYMSNLMRRVRGDSAPGVSAGMAERSTSLAPGLVAHAEPAAAIEPTEPLEPLDLEGLKARRRHTSRPLDLAALREIANDSARIAMAEHKERRHVESVMNRSILFSMTAGAAGYALYMAPGVDSPWFWAGAAAAFAAGGLGIQLLMLMRRRFALHGRRLNPLAKMTPAIDFSSLATAPVAPVDQPQSDA